MPPSLEPSGSDTKLISKLDAVLDADVASLFMVGSRMAVTLIRWQEPAAAVGQVGFVLDSRLDRDALQLHMDVLTSL